MYRCDPCKKAHLVNDGERVPLIITSTSIYKWFDKVTDHDFRLHVDYIQIPGSKI